MEKTAQNSSGAPRRRRRRRGSGAGASQNAQNQAVAHENGKAEHPAAKEKTARPQPSHKEGKAAAQQAQPARGRHRGGQPAENSQPAPSSGRRRTGGNGNNGSQPAPAREQNHTQKPSSRGARAQRRPAEEDPGLELIARRPPKQKFANFEEYLAAHGGMTVPLPAEEMPAEAADDRSAAAGAAE